MKLVLPSTEYKASFLEALDEFRAEEKKQEIQESILQLYEEEADFPDFVEKLKGRAEGKYLPEGYVPNTFYWLVDGGRFIGWLDIRHRLTRHLRKIGGHIGYTIRPGERRKGYGKKILELGLRKAKKLGITKALITCDADNLPSAKIIEENGGIFDGTALTDAGVVKRRYWIQVT